MKLKPEFIKKTTSDRLYQLDIPVIGLTGGIATGKSTVAHLLATKGIPVINADLLVKDVYQMLEVKQHIENFHPEVMKMGEIQFPLLREKVFNNPKVKKEIEVLIYSHLPEAFRTAYERFIDPKVLVYDVPLLFERGMGGLFDQNILVYAPRVTQHERLMSRDKHASELADSILNQQMDIEEKKLKSDYIIKNTGSEKELAAEVESFLRQFFI